MNKWEFTINRITIVATLMFLFGTILFKFFGDYAMAFGVGMCVLSFTSSTMIDKGDKKWKN